jgi:beta-lactamase class A
VPVPAARCLVRPPRGSRRPSLAARTAPGRRIGDLIDNISHGATATQVCRFFHQLTPGKLSNKRRSARMPGDLADPRLGHKFVSPVRERAERAERENVNAKMFRKSGTWKQWHADAIVVQGTQWRDDILVGLIESPNGENIIRRVLPAVEELIVPLEFAGGIDD